MLRRWLYIVALAAGLLGPAAVALAHARYDHSTPQAGEVVTTAPTQVDIYTAQDMRKISGANDIAVLAGDGSRVDNGTTVVDDNNRRHMSVGLNGTLPAGRYVVNFKTLSDEDGEADHGSFAFYVGRQPTADEKAQDAKLTLTSQSEDVSPSSSHTGLYAGVAAVVVVILLAGGGFLLWRRRARGAP